MFAHLPVVRFRSVRALFVATALVTLALVAWMTVLQLEGDLHGLSYIFFSLFVYGDQRAAMWTVLILGLLVLLPSWTGAHRALAWIGMHPLVLAVATTGVLCLGALFVYRAHPLSMDEYAPVFQSQAFAVGHLAGQFPTDLIDWLIPKDFQHSFLRHSQLSGATVSGYWPAFAILLTPFTWLGVPWACNPVLSGLTVLVMHRLALSLFGNRESAALAVVFTVASPVFFANGISYYSMTAHMLFNGLFALLLLDPTPRRLLAAGIAGSIALSLHNPLPHVLFAAPWFVWLATRERGVRKLAWLASAYLPLSVPLLVGWFWLWSDLAAGAAAVATQVANAGIAKVGSALTFPTATVLLARMVGLAKVWLWAVPGLMVLALVGGWKWRHNVYCRLLAASAVATWVGYLFFWPDQGHGWGFRYFHSAWLVLPLLAAATLAAPPAVNDGPAQPVDRELTSFAVVGAMLMLVVGVGVRAAQIREFVTGHLGQLPAYAGSEERVVFLDTRNLSYGVDLVQNDPFLRGGVIRMLSAGPERNAELMHRIRPTFHKVYADKAGEVWSAAGATEVPR